MPKVKRERRGGQRQRMKELQDEEAVDDDSTMQSAVAALLLKLHLLGSMSPQLVQVVASAVMLDIRHATCGV